MNAKPLIALVFMFSGFASQLALGDVSVIKTPHPSRAILHASGDDSAYYSLAATAVFATPFDGIVLRKPATCQIDIGGAIIDCEGLGWAPLEVVQDDFGKSTAYLDLRMLQIDPEVVSPGMTLISLGLFEPDVTVSDAGGTFTPTGGGFTPTAGGACAGGGPPTVIAGTQCDTLTDSDGDKTERCCPATQTFECEGELQANGTYKYTWVDRGISVDKTSLACTYTSVPQGGGGGPAEILTI